MEIGYGPGEPGEDIIGVEEEDISSPIIDPDRFSNYVTQLALEDEDESYIQALVQATKDFDVEEDVVPELLTKRLHMLIREEAENLRLVRRDGASIPFEF